MRVPDIELLWWAGCPSTEKALGELEAVLEDAGLSGAAVRTTEIRSETEAQKRAFVGSPTILVDGQDVAPPSDDPVGLNCRVYRRRDGMVSPTPDPDVVREALQRARGRPTPQAHRRSWGRSGPEASSAPETPHTPRR